MLPCCGVGEINEAPQGTDVILTSSSHTKNGIVLNFFLTSPPTSNLHTPTSVREIQHSPPFRLSLGMLGFCIQKTIF